MMRRITLAFALVCSACSGSLPTAPTAVPTTVATTGSTTSSATAPAALEPRVAPWPACVPGQWDWRYTATAKDSPYTPGDEFAVLKLPVMELRVGQTVSVRTVGGWGFGLNGTPYGATFSGHVERIDGLTVTVHVEYPPFGTTVYSTWDVWGLCP